MIRSWIQSIFFRRRLEREMQEEMRIHLERATERLIARGLSPEEARVAAQREFGNIVYLQEQARDARGGRWLEALLADARFGLRHFARTPLTTATMIVVLALGLSVNVALFAFLHSAATLPPRGVPRDEALVRIRGRVRVETQQGTSSRWFARSFCHPEVRAFAAQRALFSDVAAWGSAEVVLDNGDAERGARAARADYVTDNYFRVLNVRPIVGAGLPAGSANDLALPPAVAVIGHRLWEQLFGLSPDILGKTLRVNGVKVTIVGVMPAGFGGAATYTGNSLWLPLGMRSAIEQSSPAAFASYDSTFLSVIARLNPGVSAEQALPAVQGIAVRTAAAMTRERNPETSADVAPLLANNDRIQRTRPGISEEQVAGAIGLLILLITSSNVSALLVGLALARRREIAVRLSLGAARARIVRQLITESVLLSLAAATLGLIVIWTLIRLFGTRIPDLDIVLDWPAAVFAFAAAIATGIVFGLSPALHATRLALSDVLKDSATAVAAGRSWLQRGLVVTQIMLTQPLLVGLSALLLFALNDLRGRPETSLYDRIAEVSFSTYAGNASLEQRNETLRRLQDRFNAVPGVVGAVPQADGYYMMQAAVHPEDRGAGRAAARGFMLRTHFAPAGYFALMDFPILRGRDFGADERHRGSNAIVVGSDLARELWGTVDPVGKRLVDPRLAQADTTPFVVVGVVDESKAGSSKDGSTQRVFVPYDPAPQTLLVRTRGPAQAMIPLLRSVARAEAPQMPIRTMRTLADIEAERNRVVLRVSGAAAAGGLLALLLSAIGLYAVVAFAVGQRTREIGIRTALGAQQSQVVGMFFLRGVRLSLLGLAIGLPLGLIVLRIVTQMMNVTDQSTIVPASMVALLVLSVASLATWLPARRAAGIDPLITLRSE